MRWGVEHKLIVLFEFAVRVDSRDPILSKSVTYFMTPPNQACCAGHIWKRDERLVVLAGSCRRSNLWDLPGFWPKFFSSPYYRNSGEAGLKTGVLAQPVGICWFQVTVRTNTFQILCLQVVPSDIHGNGVRQRKKINFCSDKQHFTTKKHGNV
jgi:hypothetical protein